MDFRITEEQELMVQAIEEAMTRENLEPYFQDCDKNHTHPEKWWEILKELGCFSMFLPEEAEGEDGEPGGGEGAVTMFLVMEALGRCGAPIYLFWDHVKADALYSSKETEHSHRDSQNQLQVLNYPAIQSLQLIHVVTEKYTSMDTNISFPEHRTMITV